MNKNNTRISFFIFILFNLSFIQLAIGNEFGRTYDVRSGLAGNCIRCILQDSIGYMWFGSQDGLSRFDGSEFTNYSAANIDMPNAYMNVIQICLHPDNKHIWVATTESLYLFDIYTEKYTKFEQLSNDGYAVQSPFSLIYDQKGQLWIGTRNGLFVYQEETHYLKHYLHKEAHPHSLPHNHVWTLYCDFKGAVWIGTMNGLARYNSNSDNFEVFLSKENQSKHSSANEFLSIIEGSPNTLWIGTWNQGLARFNTETGEFENYFKESDSLAIPRIRTLLSRSNHSLYLGSDDGFYIFNTTTHECKPLNKNLLNKSFYACFQDRENGLWLGTYFNGVIYISPKHQDIEWYYANSDKNALTGNVISQFCADTDTTFWVATEDGGLNYFNYRTKAFSQPLSHLKGCNNYHNLHALLQENDQLWIGSFSKGLYRVNLKTGYTKNYRHLSNDTCSIPNDHVYSIYKTPKGEIYIGTLAGFCRYDSMHDTFYTFPDLKSIFIYDIIEDHLGYIWLASKRDGIWRFNPQTNEFHNYKHQENAKHSPGSDWVIRCYIDHSQNLWFCTEGGGICRYNYTTDSFDNFSTEENLPNNVIYGILDDQSGYYWLSSNKGIIRYKPDSKQAQLYTVEDGLQSNQFNFRSSYQASDGTLFFGGVNGFNCFHPFRLSVNKVHPGVAISSIYMYSKDNLSDSKRVPVLNGTIEIPSNIASFDLYFESLSFVVPGKNQYAYKLEGIHKNWIYTQKNYVSFLNLKPGKYIFRVKGSNSDGYWSDNDACLTLVVLPPFWRTNTAKLIYLILIGLIIFFIIHYFRIRQKHRRARKMKELDQIKNKELYESKINFFTQVAHEIKTPVTLIKAPLEAVLDKDKWDQEAKNNLSVVLKNTNRLNELIRQLLDFRKVDKEGFSLSFRENNINKLITDVVERFKSITMNGITLDVCLPEKPILYNVDKEALIKSISNLLTNAMKHARSRITIKLEECVSEDKRLMRISVKNDGPHIPQSEYEKIFEPFYQLHQINNNKSGIGIGLSLVKILVEKHQGRIFVNPDCTEGCEFCIEIPHLEETILSYHNEDPLELATQSVDKATTEQMDANPEGEVVLPSILIVDDTKDILDFLFSNLSTDYKILLAQNGQEALQLLEKNGVDLIISDIIMPCMSGFELLKAVRSDNMLCHIPFILLSAVDTMDNKMNGLDYGADAFLEKPFNVPYMKATINNLLENRRRLFNRFTNAPTMSYDQTQMNKNDVIWLNHVNEIINSNFNNESFNIEMIAEEMAISRSNLQRKLKGLTGMPPNDYIRLIRLKTAGELLSSGQYRVNEVCFIVGFNNPSYFARCFQKQFGILPKDYAKNLQNNE